MNFNLAFKLYFDKHYKMKKTINLNLKKSNLSITFLKLSNKKWYKIHQNYAPIFIDYNFLMLLDFQYYRNRDFDLAKMYMALFMLFGGHNNYDDFKCSFSYKFKLTLKKKGKKYTYGLSMYDMKGNMPYFAYYRKPREGENPDVYQNPIDDEFSKEDMRLCTMTFISFLEGFYLGYKPYFSQSFYRVNHSCRLIYGFKKEQFFTKYFAYDTEKDYEKFQKKITSLEEKKVMQTDMSKDFWD